jgi:hypothetical protein
MLSFGNEGKAETAEALASAGTRTFGAAGIARANSTAKRAGQARAGDQKRMIPRREFMKALDRLNRREFREDKAAKRQGLTARIVQQRRMAGGIRVVPPR